MAGKQGARHSVRRSRGVGGMLGRGCASALSQGDTPRVTHLWSVSQARSGPVEGTVCAVRGSVCWVLCL